MVYNTRSYESHMIVISTKITMIEFETIRSLYIEFIILCRNYYLAVFWYYYALSILFGSPYCLHFFCLLFFPFLCYIIFLIVIDISLPDHCSFDISRSQCNSDDPPSVGLYTCMVLLHVLFIGIIYQ